MDINNLSINDYQKLYIDKRVEYFKKYFKDGNVDNGLLEMTKNGINTVLQTYLKLSIICECTEIIKDNETFNYMSAEEVNDIYNGLKSIFDEIENIVNNIAEGFEL